MKILKFILNSGNVTLTSDEVLKCAAHVTEAFTLIEFKMEKDYMAKVIEAAFQSKNIAFLNCMFTGTSLYKVAPSRNYRVEKLIISHEEPKYRFGLDELKRLCLKLSETQMKESLKSISLGQNDEAVAIRAIMND